MDFLIIAALFIGVMWFMTSRARKQQAAAMAFRDSLEPGQEVMTIGRMYGTVLEVDGDRITLELSDGVVGVWDKAGISRLVEPVEPTDDEELDDDEEYLDDEEFSDDEYDGDEDEYDDEDLEDEEAADGEADEDGSKADEADDASDESDWADVDVPDDASSLTDPDEDENKPR